MFTVEFFKTAAGNVPVLDWLKDLSKEDKVKLGTDLRTVQLGFPIGMPVCKPLGDGLYEVRSSLPSKTEARIIFFQKKDKLVVVEGFIKKTEKTPKTSIDIAKKRKDEYLKSK